MRDDLAILHCLRAPVGGLFRHVRDLAAEQARRGNRVGVVCDSLTADPLTEQRLAQLAPHLTLGLHRVAMSRQIGWADVTAWRAIRDHSRTLDIAVLHGHGSKGGAYARLAGASLRFAKPELVTVYTPHGGSLHYHPASWQGRFYMGLERALAHHTSGIVFESAYSGRLYGERVVAGGPRMRVIPNGVLVDEFEPVATAPTAADLLFIGELRMLKGVDVLLRALADVRCRRPVSLTIVGTGPDEALFKALCSALGLDDAVTFAGAMPARRAFTLGRALVVPSRAESFPYVVLEAAAAAIPLIASDVGGIPEIVAGTDTALIPPDDIAALAGSIEAVVTRPDAAAAKARRLQKRIAGHFTVTIMTDAIDALYAECLMVDRSNRQPAADRDRRASAVAIHGGRGT